MNSYKTIAVCMGGKKVGTLAQGQNHLIAFQYDSSWLSEGFSISPLSLPLTDEVFFPKSFDTFEGLFGIFADSLPDGWGRLLVDRLLRRQGADPFSVSALDRLAIVGSSGAGALTYHPEYELKKIIGQLTLDELAVECRNFYEENSAEHLDEIFAMGGSSGGARPKIFFEIDGEEWIVKFPSSVDRENIGEEEYDYSLCARECGIEMAETRLLSSSICSGFFATKRFDRKGLGRIHMASASALLETSHRVPNLDYHLLMRLTMRLTQSYEQVERLFRLMCFNVYAHNRDDHSKNFSYLYEDGVWCLSPAYDLTYSSSIGGEHATTINGNGQNPGAEDLLAVAKAIGLNEKKARLIAKEVREIVGDMLGKYLAKTELVT